MQKAYIILAHNKPAQLGRLVRSLDDRRSYFYIHIDRNCELETFTRELPHHNRCQLIKNREQGAWGQFGIVKATISGLQSVAREGISFGVVSLISGQDYPLHSNAYLDRFFERHHGRVFMEFFPIPAPIWTLSRGGLDRIELYHLGDRRRRSRQRLSRLVTGLANISVIFKRHFPQGLVPYGGWQWWSIPMPAVDAILQFIDARPDYVRFHRWSLLPDEMFFQTILLNSRSAQIQDNLVNNCLRFIDWDNPNPTTPAVLTNEYFQALGKSNALFGRKFDSDRDANILDQLDALRREEDARIFATDTHSIQFTSGPAFPASAASPGTKHCIRECFPETVDGHTKKPCSA